MVLSSAAEAAARAEVTAIVKKSGSSFTAGMRCLPPSRREGMFALYAFCRVVDDIADDGPTEPARRAGLAIWRAQINALFSHGATPDAVTRALHPIIARFGLIEKDFQDIIDGMEMDAGAPMVAPDWNTLDLYCDRVASAVGRASVRIFGDSSANAMTVAHHLGRALQLTNILRDLHEDGRRGRLYLPREELERAGLPLTLAALQDQGLRAVCRVVAARAETHFSAARAALGQADARIMRPAWMMGAYYHAILAVLRREDWRMIQRRARVPLWQKIWLMLRPRW